MALNAFFTGWQALPTDQVLESLTRACRLSHGSIDMDVPLAGKASLLATTFVRMQAKPAHCALRYRGASVTSANLLQATMQLAARLEQANVCHGTRVGVCLERGPGTIALLLALWSRGAIYVPLDPTLPRERLYTMCLTASLDLIVTEAALHHVTATLPCALLVVAAPVFGTAASPIADDTPVQVHLDASDLAYILFTSGSSGTPKGVCITHGNLATLFAAILPLLDLRPGFRILGCANFAFDISFFELLAPLLCGGTLVLADSAQCSSPLELQQLVEHEAVTVVQATPSLWQLLTALPWHGSLQLAIATGEALLRATASEILRRSERLWNLYGPTECTLWASAHRVTVDDLADSAPAIVSIGHALPGYVLTLQKEEALPDEPAGRGELIISGAGVGLGYCDGDDANGAFEECALNGTRRYHSGDFCHRDAQGRLHYLGRRDMQVKHNGYRIEPGEIEQLLQRHMSIRRAACAVRPANGTTPSLLFACVEFRPGLPNRNKSALNDYLADHLPPWMLPQRYFFVDQLPVTMNGKLDRKALLALAEPVIPPCTDASNEDSLDARVAAVFCEVLDIERIGPCDSFLDFGGSSMLAATLVLVLNERFGSALTLRQALATPPTVNRIVQLLRAAPGATSLAS
jgi:polyketide synthase PksJ